MDLPSIFRSRILLILSAIIGTLALIGLAIGFLSFRLEFWAQCHLGVEIVLLTYLVHQIWTLHRTNFVERRNRFAVSLVLFWIDLVLLKVILILFDLYPSSMAITSWIMFLFLILIMSLLSYILVKTQKLGTLIDFIYSGLLTFIAPPIGLLYALLILLSIYVF